MLSQIVENVQFIKENGENKFVVLKREEYEKLIDRIEDLSDLVTILELRLSAKPDDFEDWEIAKKELRFSVGK